MEKASEQKKIHSFERRIVHDLRSPLHFMQAMSKFMEENASDEKLIKEYATRMYRSAARGLEIIDGIYDLCHITDHRYEFETFPLREIIEEVKVVLQKMIQVSETKVTIEGDVQVFASRKLLTQVIQNLITNSIKFSAESENPEILIKLSDPQNGKVTIQYEDNGPGIPEQHREKIFEAFERLHGQEFDGLGLGLNMVKKIVELHGGQVSSCEPTALKGACFKLELSMRQTEREKVEEVKELHLISVNNPGKKLTVILEDISQGGFGGSCDSNAIPEELEKFKWIEDGVEKFLEIRWQKVDLGNDKVRLGACWLEQLR